MANSLQARKRARQAQKRRLDNAGQLNTMRTHVKKVLKAIGAKDLDGAETAYKEAMPIIDRTANKGLIHKNKAARHKNRLNKQIHALRS